MEQRKTKTVETKTTIYLTYSEVEEIVLNHAGEKYGFKNCEVIFESNYGGLEGCLLKNETRTEEEINVPE